MRIKKHILYIPFILLLLFSLSLCVFAEEGVIYVCDGGTGDGASPDAPSGSLYEASCSDCNVICVCGKMTIDEYVVLKGNKTLTSHDGKVDYRKKGAALYFGGENGSGNVFFDGEYCLENIDIVSSAEKERYFICGGNKTVFGNGVSCRKKSEDSSNISVIAGFIDNDSEKDYFLSVSSGSFGCIYTGNRDVSHNGNVVFEMYGGSVIDFLGGEAPVNGDVVFNLHGGSVSGNAGIVCDKAEIDIDNCSFEYADKFEILDLSKQINTEYTVNVKEYSGNIDKLKSFFKNENLNINSDNTEKNNIVEEIPDETEISIKAGDNSENGYQNIIAEKEIALFFTVLGVLCIIILIVRKYKRKT